MLAGSFLGPIRDCRPLIKAESLQVVVKKQDVNRTSTLSTRHHHHGWSVSTRSMSIPAERLIFLGALKVRIEHVVALLL